MRVVRQARSRGIQVRVADVFRTPVLDDLLTSLAVAHLPENHLTKYKSTAATRLAKYCSDVMLKQSLMSRLNVGIGEIEDIAPATDFQSYVMFSGLLETRGYSNYLYVDLDSDVGLEQVSGALKGSRLRIASSAQRSFPTTRLRSTKLSREQVFWCSRGWYALKGPS
jgi:hypothetical protein